MTTPLGVQDADGRLTGGQGYDPLSHQFTSPQSAPAITDSSTGIVYAPLTLGGNTGLPVNAPAIVQKAQAVSTGSVATLAKAFANPNVAGNTIVVVAGCGNGTAMTVADSNGNVYTQAVTKANSTTFEAAIFFSVGPATGGGIVAGANTVTVTNVGTAASMALEIYEVSGLLAQVAAQPDTSSPATGTSATASAAAISASSPNSLIFMGVAVGTAAQAVSAVAGTSWTLDSTQNSGGTPAGLFTFGALSQYLANLYPVIPQATLAGSEPFALAAAIFKPVVLGVSGTVNLASDYPSGAIPITADSGNVAAGTCAATLAAVAGKTTYITGYQVTSSGSTGAAVVTGTITGVVGGPLHFTYCSVAGVTLSNQPLLVALPYPIPASALNTTIVVSLPSLGTGNTNTTVSAFGFQL